MKNRVTIHINNRPYEVEAGQTIMQAADGLGFHIPRLCYHPRLSIEGSCRVCIVEVEGMRNYVASCAYPVADGMKIHTNTDAIRDARRDIVELILDNHPLDCHTCDRSGKCELQSLAHEMGIRERGFEGERKHAEKDLSSPSIVRDPEKCILCGRCVRACSEVQKVNALGYANRGFKTTVTPAFGMPLGESVCTACGQCANVCPTGALVEKNQADELFRLLNDLDTVTVVQVAPAVRAAIGESFGLPAGRPLERETAAALRMLGFDYVFDTQFSADLTIVEEGSELLERLKGHGKLPMITSCSSAWMKALEQFYPDLIENASTCKSPMSMQSALVKTYFADRIKADPKKVVSVAVMPCTAKKYEASRSELMVNGMPATDLVITTRELAWMLKSAGIDLPSVKGEDFDSPLGESTGAGTIFGATGGVMEAALRTAYELATGETLENVDFEAPRGIKGIKEGAVMVGDTEVRYAVAHGLGNANTLLETVRREPGRYHFIEIMACPGGCVGGGGQPYACEAGCSLDELVVKRAGALYGLDKERKIRKSHENPDIKKIYREFLGKPLGEKSHELLHTHYREKSPKGIVPCSQQAKAR